MLLQIYDSNLIFKTEGLAWDWVNEKLYWSDRCDKDIEVFDPKTGYRKVLLQTGSGSDPRNIVVDPSTRLDMHVLCIALSNYY